jgi:hypothetical protein
MSAFRIALARLALNLADNLSSIAAWIGGVR